MRPDLRTRLESKIARHISGCWLWTGAKSGRNDKYKHGTIGVASRKSQLAHRVAWQLYRGEIPPGMQVLHRCDNPLCVNPDHLFLGTHADNMADMKAKRRSTFGERSAKTKFTEDMVRYILNSTEPNTVLAIRFSVNQASISNIRHRKHWRHIEAPPVKYQRMGRVQSAETRAKISATRYRLFAKRREEANAEQ
jgi:hypothetical protein